ncbi:hypothetical protein BFW38_10830 [Terasakiispira papahanaumokuakeensis]|uniref:GGDEF domain-containing protein n=1 Tax=Terasakiispira papahanaumokuakeensis TaxID=197479 RepID=A0A1E2VAC6_9GAMM|nr:GGDEF domain-containing protein [Terasakiispira papahanaumokuakeensis]ODC03960.1 hypothetical protein BFW38_10830 [Terasakiispira papahanaumokuakeensis]
MICSQPRRFVALLYAATSLLLLLLAANHYMAGFYQAILLPAVLAPIFLGLALLRWHLDSAYSHDPAAIVALICMGLLIVLQPSTDAIPWRFVPMFFFPLLACLLLPKLGATLLSVSLGIAVLAVHPEELKQGEFLLLMLQYGLGLIIAITFASLPALQLRQLASLSDRDNTTDCYNDRHLKARLKAEIARSRATRRPLGLLLIELHQYESLRHDFGLSSSEQLMRDIVIVLRRNSRAGDELYRFDDQTLLLLLPNTTLNGALVLRERLHRLIQMESECELGPIDMSVTPLTLQPGEQIGGLWQRLRHSCYHTLSERLDQPTDTPTRHDFSPN